MLFIFSLSGKLLVDFRLVIIERFSVGVTALALRANIELEVGVFEGGGSIWPKILGRRGRLPPTICTQLDRPCSGRPTTLPLKVFVQKNFVADFLPYTEKGHFAFLRPL